MNGSSTVCVDASFVVRLLLVSPQQERATALWAAWQDAARELIAPGLLRYEVTNAIHRYARSGQLDPTAASSAVAGLLRLPTVLRTDDWLHARALELAARFALAAAYDAHYLALAEAEGAELWTADAKLAKAVRPALSWVRLLGEDDPAGGAGGAP